jgi:signal transduction histidine kinase/tetratricopeptide (TPR) repeat protein
MEQGFHADAGRLLGGRFLPERVLKLDTTLLASDLRDGARVVIKSALADDLRLRLAHQALTRLQQPADLLSEGDRSYLVRPFVDGEPLSERLQRGTLSVADTVRVGRDLLTVLDRAHEHGILHRDIKPANIILRAGNAVLIDYGLPPRDQSVSGARYLAPEQAGLMERGIDERADLYALGVVLFECLAGKPPIEGETISEVLRQHLSTPPPALRQLRAELPHAFDDFVQRLLRKDPRDRYQSAAAAIADLDEIAHALDRGDSDPAITVGRYDRRRTLTEPAFIGRVAELAAFEHALGEARGGRGGVLIIEAESGGGKSRLLAEMLRRAAQRVSLTLHGQGTDQAAQRPLQLLDGVVDGLLAARRLDPERVSRIVERLEDHADALRVSLPALGPLLPPPRGGSLGPEAYGEARSLPALVALFEGLGEVDRPAVVLLDDVQWADETMHKLLERYTETAKTSRYVLVVAACRADEATAEQLRRLPAIGHLKLSPFGADEVRRLAESMAGPLPDKVLDVMTRLSQGNPFMASAVLQGLVETGAVADTPSGWSIEPDALADVRLERRAGILLTQRLERLPSETLRLLTCAALIGKRFEVERARLLAGQSARQAMNAVELAAHRQVLWIDASGVHCTFVHDRIRQALIERLPADERRALHNVIARQLEESDPTSIYDLAYHFDAAGLPGRALPWALTAAADARARHALEVAERYYRIAERGAEHGDPAVRAKVAEGLGDILMLRGRYDEAGPHLAAARALATSKHRRADLEGKLGELAFKRGEVNAAIRSLERALELLGKVVPRRWPLLLLFLAREVILQVLHSLFPRAFVRRRALDHPGADRDLNAVRVYSRLAYAYWFHRGPLACAWAHLRGMNLAERYPPTRELAQAYSEHGPAMTMLPWYGRALAYSGRSLEIRRALGDTWGQGQSLHFQGVVLYSASRFAECVEVCREAMRLLSRTGDQWEANDAGANLALALMHLGDLRHALEWSERIYCRAARIGDSHSSGTSLEVLAKASGGELSRERLRSALEHPSGDIQTHVEVLEAQAVCLLRDDQPAAAVEVLERAQRMVRESHLRQEYVASVPAWLATALRHAAVHTQPWNTRRRRQLLERARRAARRGVAIARHYRNNLPHALRELAVIEAMLGHRWRVRARLDESLVVATRQGAQIEEAQTLLYRGRIGLAVGWPEARRDLARAHEQLERLHAGFVLGREQAEGEPGRPPDEEVTLSLADRFSTVLDVGRRIVAGLSREDVYQAVRDAALTLLRGDGCLVLDEKLNRLAGESQLPLSRALCLEALARRRPVVMGDAPPDDPAEGAALAGMRSALCAPIYVRDQVAGHFYVVHRQVSGLFGDDEVRLARFIATLAGAALENADGFAEVQGLLHEREQLYRQAQDALRLRNEFLTLASHELKTPITSLQLRAEVLKRAARRHPAGELPAERLAEFVAIVDRQVHRLSKLMRQMLDFSTLSAGRPALLPTEVDLAQLARDRIDAERHTSDVPITVRASGPVIGRWDADGVGQVVTTLLSNAIKFGEDRPIEIEVEGSASDAWLVVRDFGIGIPPEDQTRIFDPFERAVSPRSYGGFGLGLWIARQLVEAMGGEIRIDSAPGQGSTFTVRLPRD